MQLIAFLAVALGIVLGLHWYLWLRLVRDTTRPGGPARRLGTALMALLAILLPATLVGSRALPIGAARWLAWPGYTWLALFFYLLLLLLAAELPRLLALHVHADAAGHERDTSQDCEPHDQTPVALTRGGPAAPPVSQTPVVLTREGPAAAPLGRTLVALTREGPAAAPVSRRVVIARTSAALVGVTAAGIVGYGVRTALGAPRLTELDVALGRLPAGLDGLRIAVVSDIHLGPLLGRAHTERIVDTINERRADLVAIVGDLVDGTVDELGEAAAPLRDLVSAHGSFFVTGNHEYYSGAVPWLREIERLGVHTLVNERTEIRAGGGVLDLAGVNDATADGAGEPGLHAPDYDRALDGRDRGRPVVLLAHQPVQVHESARRGVDLQLSGHTHGGQLFPFHGLVRLQQPALSGLHRVGDTRLFVTRGAGFWGPPVRVGAAPEIAIVRLTRLNPQASKGS